MVACIDVDVEAVYEKVFSRFNELGKAIEVEMPPDPSRPAAQPQASALEVLRTQLATKPVTGSPPETNPDTDGHQTRSKKRHVPRLFPLCKIKLFTDGVYTCRTAEESVPTQPKSSPSPSPDKLVKVKDKVPLDIESVLNALPSKKKLATVMSAQAWDLLLSTRNQTGHMPLTFEDPVRVRALIINCDRVY